MKEEKVVISTHNPTMRTMLRMLALLAPFWAIYVPGTFLGLFGWYISPTIEDSSERIYWLMGSLLFGVCFTTPLLLNTLVLSKQVVSFPPLKAETLPSTDVKHVAWFWDAEEREPYMRFSLANSEHIDIHYSRLTPRKIDRLKDSLKKWCPGCVIEVQPDDMEDLISFRERFEPRAKSVSEEFNRDKGVIELPYHPHEQIGRFFESLGANEKYFWWSWITVLLVPCIARLPDITWGFIADSQGFERWMNVPAPLRVFDFWRDEILEFAGNSVCLAGNAYVDITTNPFATCMFLGISVLSLVAFSMYLFQPNVVKLRRSGLEIVLQWGQLELFNMLLPWRDIRSFKLDQFGDVANPEKWRMLVNMKDGTVANLKIEAFKGTESRRTLLRTMSEMAPEAEQDPALVRALTPAQKESFTELWLQSLSTPPKRNKLTPLGNGQRLKSGRYSVDRQLAIGGQGVAYVATDKSSVAVSTLVSEPDHKVVLKEFVLPVYTSRNVRKQALEKFEHEAKMLSNLNHPQIVELLDYFIEDHRAYLVLEHIDGMSLRELVEKQGPLGSAQVLDLARQMCTVLEYLHGLEPAVVHRDFTPENLILDNSGKLVLIDFNVAQQRQWTTTGTVVGKHAYLPPEQFRGKPCPQSDLYAMGATLFYLCAGEDPEPLTCSRPSESNESVSPVFDAIVAKLTAIELEERYDAVADVLADLMILSAPDERAGVEFDESETLELAFAENSRHVVRTDRKEVQYG